MGAVIGSGELSAMLRELDTMHRRAGAADVLARTAPGGGEGGARTKADVASLPVSVDALELACGLDILRALEPWDRAFREWLGLARYGVATEARLQQQCGPAVSATEANVRGVIESLGQLWPVAVDELGIDHPELRRFAREVAALHTRARLVLHGRPTSGGADWLHAPCLTPDCDGVVRILLQGAGWVRCSECLVAFTRRELIGDALAGAEVWVDLEAAAWWLRVSVSTVRRMVARGELMGRAGRQVNLGTEIKVEAGEGAAA